MRASRSTRVAVTRTPRGSGSYSIRQSERAPPSTANDWPSAWISTRTVSAMR